MSEPCHGAKALVHSEKCLAAECAATGGTTVPDDSSDNGEYENDNVENNFDFDDYEAIVNDYEYHDSECDDSESEEDDLDELAAPWADG